jgi:hypothetical protein
MVKTYVPLSKICLESVVVNSYKRNLLSQANGSMSVRIMGTIIGALSKTSLVGVAPERGAYTQLFAVASDKFTRDMNGAYLIPIARVGKPSKKAEDTQLAKDLWEWTEKEMKRGGFI